MTDIYSNIDQARAIAKRLIRHNEDVRRAEVKRVKRDICLYKYLESIYELDERFLNIPLAEARKTLKAKYGGNVPTTRRTGMFAIKLTHPSLDPKIQSRYAAVLRFIRKKKKPGQSIRKFVRANGDINGCVTKEKQLRDAKKSGGIGKGLKAHKVTKRKGAL
jgi:hypothetical protein